MNETSCWLLQVANRSHHDCGQLLHCSRASPRFHAEISSIYTVGTYHVLKLIWNSNEYIVTCFYLRLFSYCYNVIKDRCSGNNKIVCFSLPTKQRVHRASQNIFLTRGEPSRANPSLTRHAASSSSFPVSPPSLSLHLKHCIEKRPV